MDRTTTNLFPSQVAAMTERDVDGLQQMKLIHKKKLTKLLKFLSENPPKPEVSEHRGRAAVHMVCNTGDLVIGMLSLDYTEAGPPWLAVEGQQELWRLREAWLGLWESWVALGSTK